VAVASGDPPYCCARLCFILKVRTNDSIELMTPAIRAAEKAAVEHRVHSYEHDPRAPSYGEEAAEKLGLAGERVFKTLIVALNGDTKNLAVGMIPVDRQLDLKAIAQACGAKKAEMAPPRDAERSTGYRVGGISPLGQKRLLPSILDSSANRFETLYVSAGRRGLEIELTPRDLVRLLNGRTATIAKSDVT
jgi:Cys-tRNA(Pro)/Cys-tRNA(Cys) deacylase